MRRRQIAILGGVGVVGVISSRIYFGGLSPDKIDSTNSVADAPSAVSKVVATDNEVEGSPIEARLVEYSEAAFAKLKASGEPVLLDFYAPW